MRAKVFSAFLLDLPRKALEDLLSSRVHISPLPAFIIHMQLLVWTMNYLFLCVPLWICTSRPFLVFRVVKEPCWNFSAMAVGPRTFAASWLTWSSSLRSNAIPQSHLDTEREKHLVSQGKRLLCSSSQWWVASSRIFNKAWAGGTVCRGFLATRHGLGASTFSHKDLQLFPGSVWPGIS